MPARAARGHTSLHRSTYASVGRCGASDRPADRSHAGRVRVDGWTRHARDRRRRDARRGRQPRADDLPRAVSLARRGRGLVRVAGLGHGQHWPGSRLARARVPARAVGARPVATGYAACSRRRPTSARRSGISLSGDVLADRTDRSTQAAIAAIRRAAQPPWAPALPTRSPRPRGSRARPRRVRGRPTSLWALAAPARRAHPTGLPAGTRPARAARARGGSSSAASRAAATPATARSTRGPLRALRSGARLPDLRRVLPRGVSLGRGVAPRSGRQARSRSYVVDRGTYLEIRAVRRSLRRARAAATFDGARATRFHCTIYDDRPRTCRDFTLGSAHCLTARRRVGLSL